MLVLNFTLTPLPGLLFLRFIIGALFIIVGLALLFIGVDSGFLPFGDHMGATFMKSNKMRYIIIVGFIFGFFVIFAEPDLHVLTVQVADALSNVELKDIIRIVVASGSGVMLLLGIIRIVKGFPMNITLIITYAIAFVLLVFADSEMIAIAFDSSAAATGIITVPLVLALAKGISSMKRDSKSAEVDSFGLVGIMASGAVIGVLVLNMFFGSGGGEASTAEAINNGSVASLTVFDDLVKPFITAIIGYGEGSGRMPGALEKTLIGLLPIVIMLFAFQKLKFHLRTKAFLKILIGFVYSFVGIALFFIGVNAGFLEVGMEIGKALAGHSGAVLVCFGFVLGMVGILTEPAVHVLTHQIEDVTNGYIRRRTVLATLAIGVAIAVGLSMLRIVIPGLMLWHILLPGFAISLILTFFVPKLFVGIAFDAGGVASGPMAATFVLSFARGAAEATYLTPAAVAAESFGVIALVAMTPLIALQALGLIYKLKSSTPEFVDDVGEYELIYFVVNMGVSARLFKVAEKHGIHGGTVSIGRGSVHSRLPEILGLNEVRKEIVTMIAEKEHAVEAIKGISEDMELHKPHHGIAFSYPLVGLISHKNTVINTDNRSEVKEAAMHQIIHTIVGKGMAEDVIDAANKAGARGGTIINARSGGEHGAHKLFSVEVEDEKEEVFIISKAESTNAIVESIKECLNLDEPGNGIMFVMDVNGVYGIHD